jgi:hypothetical protein
MSVDQYLKTRTIVKKLLVQGEFNEIMCKWGRFSAILTSDKTALFTSTVSGQGAQSVFLQEKCFSWV